MRWRRSAPVKAPGSWPQSSVTASSADSVPQLIATNGPSLRGLALWIACASSSLPVPDSPMISVG